MACHAARSSASGASRPTFRARRVFVSFSSPSETEGVAVAPNPRLPTISFVTLVAGVLLGYQLLAHTKGASSRATQTIVPEALNLGGRRPLVTHPVRFSSACGSQCQGSRRRSP